MNNNPKVTILPPAKQTVFFQEYQFDEEMGEGADPIRYLDKRRPTRKKKKKEKNGGQQESFTRDGHFGRGLSKLKQKRTREAKEALKGHPHAAEILKLLRG
jgi:hypothetical protein